MILVEIVEPSATTMEIDEGSNKDAWRAKLDVIEEKREEARVWEEASKQQTAKLYNKLVVPKSFEEGTSVLRKIELQRKSQGEREPTPNWERPYQVIQKLRKEAYKIAELKRQELPRTWNTSYN